MNLLVITGHQRSGTSVYRNALAQFESIVDFGEIFTEERSDKVDPGSFYHFSSIRKYSDSVASYKTVEERWHQLEEYRDYLMGLYPERSTGIIDVKLSFLHNLNATSQLSTSPPLFLRFCMENNIPIIHFYRRDIVSQYISLKIAEQFQRWHYTTEEQLSVKIEPFDIDLREAAWDIASMNVASNLMIAWISGYPSGFTFVYEEMYDGSRLKPEYEQLTKEIFGLGEESEVVLPFQRTPVVAEKVIKNIAELRGLEGVASSRFEFPKLDRYG